MKLRSPFCLFCTMALGGSLCMGAAQDTNPVPVTITIKTKPAQMKYDVDLVRAAPGAAITLTLQNDDDLPHNLVVCKPKEGVNDKGLDVAMEAWNLGEAGMKQDWIPQNSRVIAHTRMVNPHQSETIYFTAPEGEGAYPFVCTFPGHALLMNGELFVAKPVPPIKGLHYRYYLAKDGANLDRLPPIESLTSVEEEEMPAGKLDINMHWKERKSNFVYQFEGNLECPKDGSYQFTLGSDDGSAVWIDDKEIIKSDGVHPFSEKAKKVKLTKGDHRFRAEYFQAGGEAQLYLAWSGPDFRQMPLSVWEPSEDLRKSDKDRFYGIPLEVTNEARIYRNFIAGCSPRAIAVGYPGGVNLCWDADQMNLALVWQGAFMDAKRHWTDRGVGDQPPLGYGVAKLGIQRALGILESQAAPWVPSNKKDQPRDTAYRFHGYELDAKRFPTFRWEFDGISAEERFQPAGEAKKETAALKRTIELRSPKAVSNLYFLALKGKIEPRGKSFWFENTVAVTVSGDPIVRKDRDLTEVLLPVVFTDGKAELTVNYNWSLK